MTDRREEVRGWGSRDPEMSLLGRVTLVVVGLCAGGCLLSMVANGLRCDITGRASDSHERRNNGRYTSSSSSK